MYRTNSNQQQFIRSAIKHSLRTDGRTNSQYRTPYIKTNIINQANSSISLSFEFNQISFYVTIKLTIVQQKTPSITLSIDSVMKKQEQSEILALMKNILTTHYITQIPTEDFKIPKSSSSLKVFVDVVLLSYPHESLLHTISFGINLAFGKLQIPVLKALVNEITGEEQIEVEDKWKVFGKKLPVLVVVGECEGQLVCDMTAEEYEAMDFVVAFVVEEEGDGVGGSYQMKGAIDPEALQKVMRFAQKAVQGMKVN